MMTKRAKRVAIVGGLLVIAAGVTVSLMRHEHPDGFLGFTPAFHSSTTDEVKNYMNNFNALARTGEALQWQLDIGSIQRVNAAGYGVYAYEGIDAATSGNVLVLWPADDRYRWSRSPDIPIYIARIRNRCPQFCDIAGLKAPTATPRPSPPNPVTAAGIEHEQTVAKAMIARYTPGGRFRVWGVFLSKWLIGQLPALASANNSITITMGALDEDGSRPRAIILPTNSAGQIIYGTSYVSNAHQIKAGTPADRPK